MEPLAERRVLLSRSRDDLPHPLPGLVVEPEALRMTRSEAAGRMPLAVVALLPVPTARRVPDRHGQARKSETREEDARYQTREPPRPERNEA